MSRDRKTEWWAAWIHVNGRSRFTKPHALYEADWESTDYWDKGGNDAVRIEDVGGFGPIELYGGFTFTSKDRTEVQLVIDSCETVLRSIAKSWGLTEKTAA